MKNALLVASGETGANAVKEILLRYGITEVVSVSNGMEARRRLVEREFDLLVVNAPLSDEYGDNLAKDVAGQSDAQVLLLVREQSEEIALKMEEYGVYTLIKPLNRLLFLNVLRMANASFHKIRRIYEEKNRLQERLKEMKLINNAKCLLMERLYYTEESAHKMIERTAMNERKSKAQVAREIIEKYR